MIDWKLISDEQKTGEEFLVYANVASVDIVHVASWSDGADWEVQGFASQEDAAGWWSYVRGSVSQEKLDDYRTPTHWAPFNPPGDAA